MASKSFSVGMLPDVHKYRRVAEQKIAWVCFGKHDRRQVPKPLIWEKIVSAIALSTDADVKRFFGDGDR